MSRFEQRSINIDCCGESLLLLPERAIFWPRLSTLFVADVHVGKEHVFGRSGIAIPGGISERTLNQLFAIVDQSCAQRLIVLGDFLHAMPRRSERWLSTLSANLDQRKSLSMMIVAGNHDKPAGRQLIDKRIAWRAESVVEPPFVLQHVPGSDPKGYVLAGHLHPVWRIGRARRSTLRAPAFWFSQTGAVLPAFSEFTGGQMIKPDPEDQIYMTGPDCVIPVPTPEFSRS